jgi:dihydrofolate reductase
MRKLVLTAFMSLDGVVSEPGEWQGPWFDDDCNRLVRERIRRTDAVLLGRGTYDVFAGAWPDAPSDEFVDRINSLPKYVASTTLDKAEWNNTTIIAEDVEGRVAELKNQDGGDILIYGVGSLAHTMLRAKLVDELEIWVHPVILGKPDPQGLLVQEGTKLGLKLVRTETTGSGIIVCFYERDEERTLE